METALVAMLDTKSTLAAPLDTALVLNSAPLMSSLVYVLIYVLIYYVVVIRLIDPKW